MNRRDFVRSAATAGIGVSALGVNRATAQTSTSVSGQAESGALGALPKRPNIILFITDQERATQYFPDDWEKNYLPTLTGLKQNGLSFSRAYCPTCMCSPSRASTFTGLFPAQHGVTQALSEGCEQSPSEVVLDPTLPNLASVLRTAGYKCFYKGKWHMSKAAGVVAQPSDVSQYGFDTWDPPDAGGNTSLQDFGGGIADNDNRFLLDALNFINTYDGEDPFCLVISLVNPHDVLSYPSQFAQGGYGDAWLDGPWNLPDGAPAAQLPSSISENLLTNYKPSTHEKYFVKANVGLGILPTDAAKAKYLNFYSNLIQQVDNQWGSVVDALRNRGFIDNSLIIRFADHGEMGMSHGGMRQKSFVMYEEALNVPLIFSNPMLYDQVYVSDQLISLVDLLPTVATIADVPNRDGFTFAGRDMSSVVLNPNTSETVQENLIFTYDDIRAAQCVDELITPPNRLQALIQSRYKLCKYYDGDGVEPEEWEMYDLQEDPTEVQNVANPDNPLYDQYTTIREELMVTLNNQVNQRLQPLPPGVIRYFGALTDLSGGWYSSSWFGQFYGTDFPWIYHVTHGWLFCGGLGAADNEYWFYDLELGWWYTQADAYSTLYRASDENWLYYERGTSDPRVFYDFTTDEWITVAVKFERIPSGTTPLSIPSLEDIDGVIPPRPDQRPLYKTLDRSLQKFLAKGSPYRASRRQIVTPA